MKRGIQLNKNGQPLISFLKEANIKKQVYCLIGILEGIISDNIINQIEKEYFNLWLDDNLNYSLHNQFEELKSIINSTNSTKSKIQHLKKIISKLKKVYNKDVKGVSNREESSVEEVLGFIKGVICDNEITQQEFDQILLILQNNQHILNLFPINIITDKFEDFVNSLQDENLSDKEYENLEYSFITFLKKITGQYFIETGSAETMSVASFYNQEINTIENKNICLTGKFRNGIRTEIQKNLIKNKAFIHKNVRRNTDILLIGMDSSRDWINTSHGRKIELANTYNKLDKSHQIIISSEQQLFQFLELPISKITPLPCSRHSIQPKTNVE